MKILFRCFGDPDPKAIRKRSENDPKTIRKRSEDDPKTSRKLSENDPKTIPPSGGRIGTGSENDPKTISRAKSGDLQRIPLSKPPINNKVHTKGCKWRSTKCLVSIWGWDGVPKRVTDPKIRIARRLQTEQGSGWKLPGCHQEDWT